MQPKVVPNYQSPHPRIAIPWHDELRFTLVGLTVGLLVSGSVLFACLTGIGLDFPLLYLSPLTLQLSHVLPPINYLFLFFILVSAFTECVVWGMAIDWCRTFARLRRRRSGVA